MILAVWPENVEGWVGLIVLIVSLVGSIAALIPTIIKLVSVIRKLAKEKNWDKIRVVIEDSIIEAEKTARSGAEKKEIVIKSVKKFCEGLDIEIDEELLENISGYIDKLVGDHNELKKIETRNSKKKKAS